MCDHMFAMQKALDLISEAQERERIEKEQEGLIRETEPSPRAKAGGFDIATTMRIVMGQLTWLTRELGDLVGLCIGDIDLDALAVQILTRFNRSFHLHRLPSKVPSSIPSAKKEKDDMFCAFVLIQTCSPRAPASGSNLAAFRQKRFHPIQTSQSETFNQAD